MQTREAQYDPPKPENKDQDRRQARGDKTTGQCARMKAMTPHARMGSSHRVREKPPARRR